MEGDNTYRKNPILSNIIENKKVKSSLQDKQYREQVEGWKKLLAEKDPWIEKEKFVKLFDMYDFDASEQESKDFFSFKISSRLAPGESQQEWKEKQHVFVILTKLHGRITEPYMKVLTAKLQNQKAIIISIVNDNPLDFLYDTDKICHIDKDLLECLLYYRIDAIKRGNTAKENGIYGFIAKKRKV